MARQTTWGLALLVTCVAAGNGASAGAHQVRPAATQNGAKDTKDKDNKAKAPAPGPDERERWKWWLYDRAELGINDQQSASINAIFESTLPKLRETREELDRAEEEMARIIKEHKADLAVVSGQLDRLGGRALPAQQDAHPDALPHAPVAQRRAADQARGVARPARRGTRGPPSSITFTVD